MVDPSKWRSWRRDRRDMADLEQGLKSKVSVLEREKGKIGGERSKIKKKRFLKGNKL